MMKAIGDNIVELAFIFMGCFFLFGLGWLINSDENRKLVKYNQCIAAGMQYVAGDCVK